MIAKVEASLGRSPRAPRSAAGPPDRAPALAFRVLGLCPRLLPTRPRDQLPTTGELLELAVARARDPANGEPALRAQMLTAIANVHHQRGRAEPARHLAAEAVALAREDAGSPRILVAALRQQAEAAMQQSAFALAQSALAEATALQSGIDGDGPRSALAVSLLQDQAMALATQQDYAGAIALLEPAWREASANRALPPALVDRVAGTLALLYSAAYRPADALPILQRRAASIAAGPRKDSLEHAITLANLAGALADMGELAAAEQRANEAIALHDRLFDAPSTFRGAARLKRAQVWLRQGRHDEALAEADAATREWALSDGSDPDTDPFEPINRLPVLLHAGRWEALAGEAERGRERLDRGHGPDVMAESRLRTEAWGALAHCALGRADAAAPLLDAARVRIAGMKGTDPRLLAATVEAEARCLAAGGNAAAALAKLAEAAGHDAAIPPGDHAEIARRTALATAWRDARMP